MASSSAAAIRLASRALLRRAPSFPAGATAPTAAAIRARGACSVLTPAWETLVSSSRIRSYSNSSKTPTSAGDGSTEHYVSPLEELFERMERDGPTTLGTTAAEEGGYHAFGDSQASKRLKCGVPESKLRFSTTSFGRTMNDPHVHPNEHRVVMKLNLNDVPLDRNGIEMEILREIVGTRLNDERNELRLMSNQFGSRIENKRHLVDMLDRIVLSCQRLAKELQDSASAEGEAATA